MSLFPSIGFTICALFFISMITYIYFSKKKFRSIENTIYRFLLVLTVIMLVIEILSVITMANEAKLHILNIITTRSYITGCIIWTTTLVLYVYASGKKYLPIDEQKKKFKRNLIIAIITDIILCSLVLFLPNILTYKYTSKFYDDTLYVIGGNVTAVLYVLSFILIVILLVSLQNKNSKIPSKQKKPLYLTFFFFIVATAYQLINNTDFNDLTYIFAVAVVSMYFTIENQDSKLVAELEESKEEAIKANKARTEFLSNMSHDIRTPMNTILGFSDSLLREENLTEEIIKRDSQSIYEASVSLLDLINNILDVSRIESGKEVLDEKNYELKTILLDTYNLINEKATKKNIEFNISIDETMPSIYYGDCSKISKILSCVLINALENTSYGRVSLNVFCENVDGLEALRFNISNTGHAMKVEDFEKDFNEFMKLGNGMQNNIDSVALGFMIAKKLLTIIGGEMKFLNEVGKGTNYYITIKQKVISASRIGNIFEDVKKVDNNDLDLSNKKVLVVDDNKINITLMQRLLEKYNINVTSAVTGDECINLVKDNKYDLIFLDHMMPDKDGVKTLEELKEKYKDLPSIVALTANSNFGIKEFYINKGFDDYLSKPINKVELEKIIYNVFSSKK